GEHQGKNVGRPVRVFRLKAGGAAPAPPPRRVVAADKPGLAVLAFQNLSSQAEPEFFVDSVAEDLTTELARPRWFSVIARTASFGYKGRQVDAKQVARELGVRYVVEGSIRVAGPRVRIACQLVQTATGNHLWAERFDGTLDDAFELQDRIVETAVGAIEPIIRTTEVERARRAPAGQ